MSKGICTQKETAVWGRPRNLLYFRAVRDFGIRMTQLSGKLNISLSGVSQSVAHAAKIVTNCKYKLLKQKV